MNLFHASQSHFPKINFKINTIFPSHPSSVFRSGLLIKTFMHFLPTPFALHVSPISFSWFDPANNIYRREQILEFLIMEIQPLTRFRYKIAIHKTAMLLLSLCKSQSGTRKVVGGPHLTGHAVQCRSHSSSEVKPGLESYNIHLKVPFCSWVRRRSGS
jgi:hypothetical protein